MLDGPSQINCISDASSARPLTLEQKKNNVPLMFSMERPMIRAVVQEAAALTSLVLFLGMVVVWAQVLTMP
jgi:hypothetical protein